MATTRRSRGKARGSARKTAARSRRGRAATRKVTRPRTKAAWAMHPLVGHGFAILDFRSFIEAEEGQKKLRDSIGKEPKDTHIRSIDHMEDREAPPKNGKRQKGKRLIVEMFTNVPHPIGSDTAHQALHRCAQWAQGITQAPGLEAWCCISDMP